MFVPGSELVQMMRKLLRLIFSPSKSCNLFDCFCNWL